MFTFIRHIQSGARVALSLLLLAGMAPRAAAAADAQEPEALTAELFDTVPAAADSCPSPYHRRVTLPPPLRLDTIFSPAEDAGDAYVLGLLQEEQTPSGLTLSAVEAVLPTRVPVAGPKGVSIYLLPYSLTYNDPNWGRWWANVGTLTGAMVSALVIMETLPEDATAWNRAEIQSVPPFRRWYENIFVYNPELDHDKWVFNYLLHPYAGAVYFMAARSVGFNFWRSMLTSAFISTVIWEFGVEAFVERPSYQDIVITPVVGSVIGELFYKLKRNIVANDYRLLGSPILGNAVAFLIDPVNEVLDLMRGSRTRGYRLHAADPELPELPERHSGVSSRFMPTMVKGCPGFMLTINF